MVVDAGFDQTDVLPNFLRYCWGVAEEKGGAIEHDPICTEPQVIVLELYRSVIEESRSTPTPTIHPQRLSPPVEEVVATRNGKNGN